MATTDEGAMAASPLNKEAGNWLREARKERKRSAPKFAGALSDLLKTPVTAGALYAYETGTRTVPAAVMLAAARLTRVPIELDEAAKKSLADEISEDVFRRLREKGLDV
jgi:transcriptional regulator with XRE-family HTH domain